MVWIGGQGIVYGMAWRARNCVWYGLAGMAWHDIWHGLESIVLPLIFILKYNNIMAIKINIDSFVSLSFVCFFLLVIFCQ